MGWSMFMMSPNINHGESLDFTNLITGTCNEIWGMLCWKGTILNDFSWFLSKIVSRLKSGTHTPISLLTLNPVHSTIHSLSFFAPPSNHLFNTLLTDIEWDSVLNNRSFEEEQDKYQRNVKEKRKEKKKKEKKKSSKLLKNIYTEIVVNSSEIPNPHFRKPKLLQVFDLKASMNS